MRGIGAARLDDGEHIPVRQVRRIACDCGVIPLLPGSRSQVYDVGRRTRSTNSGLRRVLVARGIPTFTPPAYVGPQCRPRGYLILGA